MFFLSIFELKFRFFFILFAFLYNLVVIFFLIDELIYVLVKPFLINIQFFIFTGLTDNLVLYYYLPFVVSLFLILPLLILQFCLFLVKSHSHT